MREYIKGLELCEGFFREEAKPILERHFPGLAYSAGLLGYGSDVLGYDDTVSTDHMWGPRFYLFLKETDRALAAPIMERLESGLPHEYKGYCVNFSAPDPNDGGVRHPEPAEGRNVSPLVWIQTVDEFVGKYLGLYPNSWEDWLALSEHRLLGFTSGRLFADGLGLGKIREKLSFYPEDVQRYLIASQWGLIAEEQAFVKRCAATGDDLGSRIVCARIAERLMRLCFLYCGSYAPYSKWFGTAFSGLPVADGIKEEIAAAVGASGIPQREKHLVDAQLLVAGLHNECCPYAEVEVRAGNYFGRDIKVIYADKIAEAVREIIADDRLRRLPLFGTLSQVGNFVALSDGPGNIPGIKALYTTL